MQISPSPRATGSVIRLTVSRSNPPMAARPGNRYPRRMGYIVLGVLLLVLLGFVVAALARGKPPRGTLSSEKPVSVAEPAAEQPTPGASATASRQQAEKARKHTPPA